MNTMEECMEKLQSDILKVSIEVSAVDRELFYNTLTVSKAMSDKINKYSAQFDDFKVQLEDLKEVINDISVHTRSMTNGGLKEALQSVLPTIIQSITTKEIEKNKSKTALLVAIVGAAGTLLGLGIPYFFEKLVQ